VKLKGSKFCLTQSLKISNTVLILLLQSVGSDWNNKMLVSAANKIGTDVSFTNLGKSFINTRKNKGHENEPWGTPCSDLAQVDIIILPFSLYSNVL
jgi:hypothetical protein